jgi:hypothetical protein
MRVLELGRVVSMLVLVGAAGLAPTSCGSGGSTFVDGQSHPEGGLFPSDDATLPDDVSQIVVNGGDSGGSPTGACTPKTCADWGYSCGKNGDGCSGVIDCGSCTAPGEFCGGGGYSKCGTKANASLDGGGSGDANTTSCTPKTCSDLGLDCGWAVDGCGTPQQCGASCPGAQYCGASAPNKCGGNVFVAPDGGTVAPQCVAKTCADQGFDCGQATDGCGQLLTTSCGACTAPQFCGGGGPNKCGGNSGLQPDGGPVSLCMPVACNAMGYDCGPAGDGCGNLIASCGTCAAPQYCGGGGKPGKCGGSVFVAPDGGAVNLCQPATCQSLGYDCGPASDGCGQLIPSCGTCGGADTCGGGGKPGQCGHTCTGLCSSQQLCDGGTPTTVTGRILAGQSAWTSLPPDPVPNVLVYVPNGTVKDFATGAACRQCGDDVSGDPLVSAYTNFDGTFTLTNVPAPPGGAQVPLVIQMGRWRRQVMFAAPQACSTTAIGDFNLPRNHGEGQIPLTAISTGNVDALECVLLKMGVDQAEFTASSGAGRIHVYAEGPNTYVTRPRRGNAGVGPGAYIADPASQQNPPAALSLPESALLGTGGSFMKYDQIMLPCWGSPLQKTNAELANLVTFADSGGHFFATHYSYSWLVGNAEFDTVAKWRPDADNPGLGPWTLNVSQAAPPSPPAAHGGTFAKWLNLVQALSNWNANAVPNPAHVSITNPRYDADGVANGSIDWIDGKDQNQNSKFQGSSLVEHFTFDTPVVGGPKCGHAIFSDFHVTGVTDTNVIAFPNECDKQFSPQEKILEYMIWDLASCVGPPRSSCQPQSCADQHLSCGPAGDGCGNQIPNGCGPCTNGQTCGGGGVRGQCGAPDAGACSPVSCADQNLACGPAGDGCGGSLSCGTCPNGQACGGAGVRGQCGAPDAGACNPRSCADQHIACGPAGDGCGNVIASCGTCPDGTMCGSGGMPGQCGKPDGGQCMPQTCSAQGISCGPAGDGCGALIASCGTCTPPQTCGGGGVPGQCGGGGACSPYTCAALGFNCGPAGDCCGGLLDCGPCVAPSTCGGGGVAGQCGARGPPK